MSNFHVSCSAPKTEVLTSACNRPKTDVKVLVPKRMLSFCQLENQGCFILRLAQLLENQGCIHSGCDDQEDEDDEDDETIFA